LERSFQKAQSLIQTTQSRAERGAHRGFEDLVLGAAGLAQGSYVGVRHPVGMVSDLLDVVGQARWWFALGTRAPLIGWEGCRLLQAGRAKAGDLGAVGRLHGAQDTEASLGEEGMAITRSRRRATRQARSTRW
jgi:hypothetical protein